MRRLMEPAAAAAAREQPRASRPAQRPRLRASARRRAATVASPCGRRPHRPRTVSSRAPQSTQWTFRDRRRSACRSSEQLLARIRSFTTSPQVAQNLTVTIVRPWLSLSHRCCCHIASPRSRKPGSVGSDHPGPATAPVRRPVRSARARARGEGPDLPTTAPGETLRGGSLSRRDRSDRPWRRAPEPRRGMRPVSDRRPARSRAYGSALGGLDGSGPAAVRSGGGMGSLPRGPLGNSVGAPDRTRLALTVLQMQDPSSGPRRLLATPARRLREPSPRASIVAKRGHVELGVPLGPATGPGAATAAALPCP